MQNRNHTTSRIIRRWQEIATNDEEPASRRIAAIKAMLDINFKKYRDECVDALSEIEKEKSVQSIHAGKLLIEINESYKKEQDDEIIGVSVP